MSLQAIFVADEPDENPEPGTTYTVKLISHNPALGLVKFDDGEPAVEVEKDVAAGSTVQICAIATGNDEFDKWSDDNEDAVRTITVNSDIELTASFLDINEGGGMNF